MPWKINPRDSAVLSTAPPLKIFCHIRLTGKNSKKYSSTALFDIIRRSQNHRDTLVNAHLASLEVELKTTKNADNKSTQNFQLEKPVKQALFEQVWMRFGIYSILGPFGQGTGGMSNTRLCPVIAFQVAGQLTHGWVQENFCINHNHD